MKFETVVWTGVSWKRSVDLTVWGELYSKQLEVKKLLTNSTLHFSKRSLEHEHVSTPGRKELSQKAKGREKIVEYQHISSLTQVGAEDI